MITTPMYEQALAKAAVMRPQGRIAGSPFAAEDVADANRYMQELGMEYAEWLTEFDVILYTGRSTPCAEGRPWRALIQAARYRV